MSSGVHERGDAVPRPVRRRRTADAGVWRRASRLPVGRRLSRLAAEAGDGVHRSETSRPHHGRRARRLSRQMSRRLHRLATIARVRPHHHRR